MTFNSLSYFLFLPIVYLIFHLAADRWRWLILLISSYLFYACWQAFYLVAALLMVTGVSYACGLRIASEQDESLAKRWLVIGSCACLATLALLKYLPFFESHANSSFGLNLSFSSAIIGIGVSYFTFQAISYLADIYLEVRDPEPHFGYYALYLAFFPKLLQGPIERAGDLLPQLKQPYRFDPDTMRSGMLLFACGLFKKVVVADRLARYADQVYNNTDAYSGLAFIIATYAYALQIYLDFAAYTDMARGTGQMFGIKLAENFNSPYFATSIADFWRRWHISFSRFLQDYIFQPLQMGWRNWGALGTAAALLVTFLVSGIWHGASWGFLVWGLLHGIYLAASTWYRPYQKRLHKLLGFQKSRWLKWWQVFVTFHLVSFAWIFFRATDLRQAWYVISSIFDWQSYLTVKEIGLHRYIARNITVGLGYVDFIVLTALLLILLLLQKVRPDQVLNKPAYFRWTSYSVIFVAILFLQMPSSKFLYFKF